MSRWNQSKAGAVDALVYSFLLLLLLCGASLMMCRKKKKATLGVGDQGAGGAAAPEAAPNTDEAAQRKKADDLWALFLSDVGPRPREGPAGSQPRSSAQVGGAPPPAAHWVHWSGSSQGQPPRPRACLRDGRGGARLLWTDVPIEGRLPW